jgi:pimeloyl-ACP methyl ester carboxylesterase
LPFSFEQSADDTMALMDHLKIDKADFFGFSNGDNIALQIGIRHPNRARKLVVASAMFKLDGFYLESAKRMLEFKDWRPEDIQLIEAPTLLMIGDAESVRPKQAVEMFRRLQHAQLAVFLGGHGGRFRSATKTKRGAVGSDRLATMRAATMRCS